MNAQRFSQMRSGLLINITSDPCVHIADRNLAHRSCAPIIGRTFIARRLFPDAILRPFF